MARIVDPREALRRIVAKYPTQKDAAAALEMSSQHLHDLLVGHRTFSETALQKIGLTWAVVPADKKEDSHVA